jgi:hypothetical protein
MFAIEIFPQAALAIPLMEVKLKAKIAEIIIFLIFILSPFYKFKVSLDHNGIKNQTTDNYEL